MNLIDGKKIAKKIEEEILAIPTPFPLHPPGFAGQANSPLSRGRKKSGLAAILVGDDAASRLYVALKEKAAKRVGIKFEKILYSITNYELRITNNKKLEEKIIKKIKQLNKNPEITGIIVQLPLPKNLDTSKIISAIDPAKDADGYHPENLKKFQNGEFYFYPPVLGAVLEILKEIKINIKEKNVALISKSEIFPIPYHAYFEKNAKNFVRCKPQDLTKCLSADIVITAIGKKHYLKAEHIKKGAVIIDIGIVRKGKKIFGDADPASLAKKAGWLTPVPGGVGPITVACLLKNTAKN